MMLCSEEVRRPLQRPVSFLLTSEVQHVNHIDRSSGAVFARWRGLGILSLPRLTPRPKTLQPIPENEEGRLLIKENAFHLTRPRHRAGFARVPQVDEGADRSEEH